ncbi:MAG: hypothetical protein KJ914_05810 [Gammaproteobacteria bacterium]|nr:hypothetical protein [Gammaproteobacteria bacterium]
MIILIILFALLFAALGFLIAPMSFFVDKKIKELSLKEMPTSEISSIIMFVSDIKEDKDISELLAYKILCQMVKNKNKKNIWLIHSPISDRKGSSYQNTYNLVNQFQNDNFNISTQGIKDVFDIKESFNVINNILDLTKNDKEIICDFTSGTKPMSLGMALACIGEKRLVYFPKTDQDDASKYLHINTGELIDIK